MASHLREPQVPEEERMSDSDDEPDDVKERKRRERLEQNRISARESRKRKKTMIEELQRTVIGLSRDNKEMNDRNESLRRQLMELGTKYPQVVPLHAIMGGSMNSNFTQQAGQGQAQVPVPIQPSQNGNKGIHQQMAMQEQQAQQQLEQAQQQLEQAQHAHHTAMYLQSAENGGNMNIVVPMPVAPEANGKPAAVEPSLVFNNRVSVCENPPINLQGHNQFNGEEDRAEI